MIILIIVGKMSEVVSANSEFKTPERLERDRRRSNSNERGRSGSNSRTGGTAQGRDGSNERIGERNMQDSGRYNDRQTGNRDRSSSKERYNKQYHNHSPQSRWDSNYSQQGHFYNQQGYHYRYEEDGNYEQENYKSPHKRNNYNKNQRGRGYQGSPQKHDGQWQGGYGGAGFSQRWVIFIFTSFKQNMRISDMLLLLVMIDVEVQDCNTLCTLTFLHNEKFFNVFFFLKKKKKRVTMYLILD